ncbi:MAG: hypothetical protein M1814_000529 [Vezdaea aestivalis]|nr:MAG: hypothetical protein M1814_000529 [Vezdaea aestivalis]
MDDLNSLDWSASPSSNANKQPPPVTTSNYYPTLRPPPPPQLSGRPKPLAGKAASGPPTNDSFSNLVSFGSSKSTNNLSLQERQKLLQQQRQKEEESKRGNLSSQFGGPQDSQFWDSLGSGKRSSAKADQASSNGEIEDILAAFTSSTKAPLPSSFPTQSVLINGSATPSSRRRGTPAIEDFDDDDPFELGKAKQAPALQPRVMARDDEDDVLGLLGKPVSELPKRPKTPPKADELHLDDDFTTRRPPVSKKVQELVEMGFPEDKAKTALASTESGEDIQAAVGILLTRAHEESRQKSGVLDGTQNDRNSRPARTRQQEPQRRRDDSAGAGGENEFTQKASQVGSTLFKSANSMWKTGRKKVQQAVSEFQQEGDPSQPKWMRDSQLQVEVSAETKSSNREVRHHDTEVTNEAAMLEINDPRQAMRQSRPPPNASSQPSSRNLSPALANGRESPRPAWMDRAPPTVAKSRSPLRRGDADADFANTYMSPARRRKPTTPTPEPQPMSLFDNEPAPSPSKARQPHPSNPFQKPISQPASKSSTPIPSRPKAPPRQTPTVSPQALQTSHQHRQAGTAHFKRGDYASAHSSYTSALTPLPQAHPLIIVLLTNRSLTSLKTGSPKRSIQDADAALALIGPSNGEDEQILVDDAQKSMRDYFSKALARKAEALEAMEKWSEAAVVWKEAVHTGVGGPLAIQGRDRCERAMGKPKTPAPAARPTRPASSAPARRPARSAAVANTQSAEAVTRLRAANKAAEAADDEKFALADTVEAKLTAWKGGKADNLRALLSSLDTVLWPEATWKKIGMAELVLPGKVKIHYMKGIAKVHPDKIPTTATTEQRMISAAVFSVLNEAWDKFKKENGL